MRQWPFERTDGGSGGGSGGDDYDYVYAIYGTVCYILCFLVCCNPKSSSTCVVRTKTNVWASCAYCLKLLQLCGGPWNSVGLRALCSISLTWNLSQSTSGPLQGTHLGTVIARNLNLLLLRSFVCCDTEN